MSKIQDGARWAGAPFHYLLTVTFKSLPPALCINLSSVQYGPRPPYHVVKGSKTLVEDSSGLNSYFETRPLESG